MANLPHLACLPRDGKRRWSVSPAIVSTVYANAATKQNRLSFPNREVCEWARTCARRSCVMAAWFPIMRLGSGGCFIYPCDAPGHAIPGDWMRNQTLSPPGFCDWNPQPSASAVFRTFWVQEAAPQPRTQHARTCKWFSYQCHIRFYASRSSSFVIQPPFLSGGRVGWRSSCATTRQPHRQSSRACPSPASRPSLQSASHGPVSSSRPRRPRSQRISPSW